ncbi:MULTISPECIES: YqeG family HAD IIIA-type phosphatase [unclassified Coleofasciculus]|uniref:YqeG family HAD IIIA-type phosphatase n=1 Tax=Cyanophyceae TaxID=3028117 RepID=UPI0016865E2A|nr:MULTISPECIES: YqeG family HAD IIIA-type phosphatase [unclassified Coleofasciculus]MBD1877904.1 YqeG family HAD IIIA-type phosphatase [Coleofasciculus sp. FACHB-T130]MBD1900591.1 YqeG family HAD IIIA-type phosphatase [Coleofasciculus sp. FACHB-125]MBD1897283.1 YqeG family HAD IIIA-type phosphatase [Coleofasciculus sp. FACHB-129]MBD1943066.1 YqeG family HAD IIIA-type phosphatase [Coleofasciculus sp. FACHB-712]MBD2540118.1 YqeG family HAD IIIA-type phosphatase [Coleofasciculus sp. FACHB-SPT36]
MLNRVSLFFSRSVKQKSKKPAVNQGPYSFPREAYSLAAIELDWLKLCGIQGIIIDLDNTIVSEDDRYVSPGAEAWIEQAKLQGFQFFILSNGKRRYRVKAWSHRLEIPAINPAKKPFPFAFRKAIKYMRLKPKQVVVIGDSRHTDVLGAWLSGCASIQVATLPHPFRWWEKLLGKRVQTPWPNDRELWDFDSFY